MQRGTGAIHRVDHIESQWTLAGHSDRYLSLCISYLSLISRNLRWKWNSGTHISLSFDDDKGKMKF